MWPAIRTDSGRCWSRVASTQANRCRSRRSQIQTESKHRPNRVPTVWTRPRRMTTIGHFRPQTLINNSHDQSSYILISINTLSSSYHQHQRDHFLFLVIISTIIKHSLLLLFRLLMQTPWKSHLSLYNAISHTDQLYITTIYIF